MKVDVQLKVYGKEGKMVNERREVELKEGQRLRDLLEQLSQSRPEISFFAPGQKEPCVWCCSQSRTLLPDDFLANGEEVIILPFMDGG